MRKKIICIYQIVNLISGKRYIGKTLNYNKRVRDHVRGALSGRVNFAIHGAIRKYGVENFSFNILELWSNKETLSEREKYWIKSFNTLAPNGYNLTTGGDGTPGVKKSPELLKLMSINGRKLRHTTEVKEKIREASIAMWASESHRELIKSLPRDFMIKQRKPVLQLDKDGTLVREYTSMHEADALTGISYKNISAVARGLRKYAGGYSWQFVNK